MLRMTHAEEDADHHDDEKADQIQVNSEGDVIDQ